MTRLTIARLPYWTMAVLLAALTFGSIYLGFRLGLGLNSFFLLVVPIGLAVWYLAEYSTTTVVPPPATTDPSVPDAAPEEFDDPVMEADRFDSRADSSAEPGDAEKAPPAP